MKIKIRQRPEDLRQLPHVCILSEPGGKFNMKMRFVGAALSVTAFRRDWGCLKIEFSKNQFNNKAVKTRYKLDFHGFI